MRQFFIGILLLCGFCAVYAQNSTNPSSAGGVPQRFAYSSAVRDANGLPLISQFIRLRFTILREAPTGTPVYQQIDTVTTSPAGIFTVVIGGGSITLGNFDSIPWQTGNLFLRVELDVTGGINFVDMGTTQLLSTPYAIAAGNGLASIAFDSTGQVISKTLDNKTSITNFKSWLTTGNAGIGGANGFIGTTDNSDLILKRMNAEGLRISAGNTVTIPGKLGLGVTNPVTSLDISGGITLRDTTVNVSGPFTLNVGNHGLIFINSTVLPSLAICTMRDGLQKGQIVILAITGASTKGVNFVNNALVNNTRVNTDGKGVNSQLLDWISYTEGNTLTLLWNGVDWIQQSSSIPRP